ncbi:hypothetical protein [Bacillus mycoides]|nr:hypothetical protein [Bacillus mycoides]MED1056927.1 hypothetical protein [Bacillus mycoides]
MNEENIVLRGAAVESSLIGSTLPPIFHHSLYQQVQQELQEQRY